MVFVRKKEKMEQQWRCKGLLKPSAKKHALRICVIYYNRLNTFLYSDSDDTQKTCNFNRRNINSQER